MLNLCTKLNLCSKLSLCSELISGTINFIAATESRGTGLITIAALGRKFAFLCKSSVCSVLVEGPMMAIVHNEHNECGTYLVALIR